MCRQDCIPVLILIVNWRGTGDGAVTLAALQALTNLAVTSSYHDMYYDNVDLVCQLALSSSATADIRLQAMKLLANLTANHEFARRLLRVQVDIQQLACR